jgi:hypothetical protein
MALSEGTGKLDRVRGLLRIIAEDPPLKELFAILPLLIFTFLQKDINSPSTTVPCLGTVKSLHDLQFTKPVISATLED